MKKLYVLTIVIFTLLPVANAHSSEGLALTALDRYVREPDSNYRYSVLDTVAGAGYKTYIVEMTSQQWLTEAEVNLPIWEHFMTITAPTEISSDIGFLTISGGSKSRSAPAAAQASDIKRALETGTVVSTLYMVPNQPLVFIDDAENPRTEDAIIAYTWDKYLRSSDDKWPLRLPMTKRAVRAMERVGMVEAMDDAVGIVLDKLEALGLADNTVIVFTSDNGGVSSGDAYSTSSLPHRGGQGRQCADKHWWRCEQNCSESDQQQLGAERRICFNASPNCIRAE